MQYDLGKVIPSFLKLRILIMGMDVFCLQTRLLNNSSSSVSSRTIAMWEVVLSFGGNIALEEAKFELMKGPFMSKSEFAKLVIKFSLCL